MLLLPINIFPFFLDETLHILYECGALEPIKMFLYSNSTKLQYTGVGAIWGMMEYEVIQETSVKDGIMEKLVSLSVDALNMDAYAMSERYRCFGCLQCSSTNGLYYDRILLLFKSTNFARVSTNCVQIRP